MIAPPKRECLGVICALQDLRPCLLYEKYTVYTGRHCLRRLLTVSDPSRRLTRWRLCLAELSLGIPNNKAADNHHADALSPLLTGSPTDVNGDDDDIPAFLLDIDDGVEQPPTAGQDQNQRSNLWKSTTRRSTSS